MRPRPIRSSWRLKPGFAVVAPDLFASTTVPDAAFVWEPVPLADADIAMLPRWLERNEADALFADLSTGLGWEVHRLRMFGREIDSPRLSYWVGDADAVYTYSRTRFEPHPWTPTLDALRERVEAVCGSRFNSVLANLYRDGGDSMGWHSDDERELGGRPVIASLSLGEERRFRFRRRPDPDAPRVSRAPVSLVLAHGSVLRMAGDTQRLYQHELPKVRGPTGPRINLTFRYIHPA
jgi:alkylated DNA repair dioxygenase AlkB